MGLRFRRKRRRRNPRRRSPAELVAALARNRKAKAVFDGFSPSHRREYVTRIDEAKRADTKAKRVAQSVEWLGEGRSRNWKYMKG